MSRRSNGRIEEEGMKNSMIWRNTLREIKGSLGRFLAIFAIVALGVGLFAGLKIVKADFLEAMTKYYKDLSFYDYRILGSLGFSDEQVAFFAAQKDVIAAEGAIFQDMYCLKPNGSQMVGRFHSLTKQVNQVVLTAGRMPENEGEILVDCMYFSKDTIGQFIRLSDENDEDSLKQVARDEFLVVGLVKSPLYVQFERGNTSLGAGSVEAFFYLPREAFTADYETEIYVKFRQNFFLYSKEYDDFIHSKEEEWKELLSQAGHMRFEELPQLIQKGETELREKKEEAWEKLQEAKEELDLAKEELEDGEKKLQDGRKELDQGREDLKKAKEDLTEGKITLEEKKQELEQAKEKLTSGEKKISDNEKLISEKEQELEAARTQLKTAKLTLQLGEMQQKLTMESLINEQKEIDSAREDLQQRTDNTDRLELLAKILGQEDAYAAQISKEREEIKKETASLDKQTEDLHKRYLECLKLADDLKAGRKEFEDGEKQLQEGEKALLEGKEALLKGKTELIDAKKKIAQGEADLRDGEKKLVDGEKEIADGEITLEEKEIEWEDGAKELQEGRQKYEDGLKEYQDALTQFEEQIQKATDALEEKSRQYREGREPDGYLLGRNTNIGYVCFESDSSIVDGIANVFPVFFFLVAALVCVTTMNRMVEEQRTQIGVLKALGYSDGRIMFKFLFYSGLAAVLGCLVGYGSGTIIFPLIIWTVYGIMYKAGAIVYTFSLPLASLSMLVSLLCSVGATYFSCGRELTGQAAQLMRPRSPKAGKRVFLERITFIWKRLGFLSKVTVRNILRYKKRLVMMVLGIGGCTGLLLTGFGIKNSIAGVAQVQFSEIETRDISVTLQREVDGEFVEELEKLKERGLTDYLAYQESAQDLIKGDAQKSVTVLTFSDQTSQETFSEYINMESKQGKKIPMPGKGEAVVTDKVAEKLHLKVGDQVTLRNDAMQEQSYVVSGIMRNYIDNFVILSKADCHPKALYVKVENRSDIRRISAALMKLENVANLSVTEDVVNRFDKMMSSLNMIVVLITCCAAGLAFIVLYNLTNINITERIREIATIKVLGFFAGETAMYVFRENLVLTFLGAMAGLGMGKMLHSFVMREIDVDMVNFAIRIYPQSYAYSIFLTFLFSVLINILMNRRLEEISMTESLKSVD